MLNAYTGAVKKGFWLVVMLAMFGALLYNMVNLTSNLLSYPVEVSISVASDQQLTFPAVTICNMSPVKRSALSADSGAVSTAGASSGKRRRKRSTTGEKRFCNAAENY